MERSNGSEDRAVLNRRNPEARTYEYRPALRPLPPSAQRPPCCPARFSGVFRLKSMMSVPTFLDVPEDLPHADDFLFAQRCLEGDRNAILEFQERYRAILIAFLRQTGASESEATDVTDSLWADLLHERENNRPRLATYGGRAALKTWLRPLVLNRLIALKRAKQYREDVEQTGLDWNQIEALEKDVRRLEAELPLIELMKDALETGFSECSPEHFVLLHLKHMDGLHFDELALMFHTSKSTIERAVIEARDKVHDATLGRVKELDKWLELTWTDFVDLCRVASPACLGVVESDDRDL